jgi:hydroxylysine kinase
VTERRAAARRGGVRTGQVADEGALAAPHAPISEHEALDLLRARYDLDGSLTRLATEKDDTFRVNCSDGGAFLLKVANPAESAQEISFQVDVMDHVARTDPSLPVPRTLPDRDGRTYPETVDRAGQRRYARLMTYLRGTPLDSAESSAPERERVGRILARLRIATSGFTHPADTRKLAWDVQHLAQLRPLLADVRNPRQRAQLAHGMERFESLQHRIRVLRKQVLHNDFSKSNIIIDHNAPQFVTGIIDFGDTVCTAVAIDVATALLGQLPRDAAEWPADDLFCEGRDLLRGYLSVTDLTDEELLLVPHLVMARVIARALISVRRARLFPHNSAYILRNTEQGWAQLDWFLQRSVGEVSAALSRSSSDPPIDLVKDIP